jgi:hypothetical protein
MFDIFHVFKRRRPRRAHEAVIPGTHRCTAPRLSKATQGEWPVRVRLTSAGGKLLGDDGLARMNESSRRV